jgi:hypothetical protein
VFAPSCGFKRVGACVQLTNTVVFFFSGAACINFFIRSLQALDKDGYSGAVAVAFWRLPIIFVFVMIVRLLLINIFAPMLSVFGYAMDWRVCSSLHLVLMNPLFSASCHPLDVSQRKCSHLLCGAVHRRGAAAH